MISVRGVNAFDAFGEFVQIITLCFHFVFLPYTVNPSPLSQLSSVKNFETD